MKNDQQSSGNSLSSEKSAYIIPDQVYLRPLIFKDVFFSICILALREGNANLFFNIPSALNSKAVRRIIE